VTVTVPVPVTVPVTVQAPVTVTVTVPVTVAVTVQAPVPVPIGVRVAVIVEIVNITVDFMQQCVIIDFVTSYKNNNKGEKEMQNQTQETRTQKMFNDYQIKLKEFCELETKLPDEIAHSILYAVNKELDGLEKRLHSAFMGIHNRFLG